MIVWTVIAKQARRGAGDVDGIPHERNTETSIKARGEWRVFKMGMSRHSKWKGHDRG